jgi:hypothetical protein
MAFPNRLAADGELLVVHRFPSNSMGLASPDDLRAKARVKSAQRSFWESVKGFFLGAEESLVPAVCIPPGARLRLSEIGEELRGRYSLEPEEDVTFEQLSQAANTYRDAIAFRNGRKVRLQDLPEGQRVTVVRIAGSETEAAPVDSEVLLRRAE